jgi:DNA-binding NarL/FixJ family response regulator
METMQRSNAHYRRAADHSASDGTPPLKPQVPPRVTFPSPSQLKEQAATEVLRVLLVEDSPLLVQRISELVAELPGIRITGTAATEAEALTWLESGDIDAVILDLQLHTGSGFGILRALHRRAHSPSVVVFTNFAINAYRDTALALGATHFLDKSRDYDRLPKVLQELSDTRH